MCVCQFIQSGLQCHTASTSIEWQSAQRLWFNPRESSWTSQLTRGMSNVVDRIRVTPPLSSSIRNFVVGSLTITLCAQRAVNACRNIRTDHSTLSGNGGARPGSRTLCCLHDPHLRSASAPPLLAEQPQRGCEGRESWRTAAAATPPPYMRETVHL